MPQTVPINQSELGAIALGDLLRRVADECLARHERYPPGNAVLAGRGLTPAWWVLLMPGTVQRHVEKDKLDLLTFHLPGLPTDAVRSVYWAWDQHRESEPMLRLRATLLTVAAGADRNALLLAPPSWALKAGLAGAIARMGDPRRGECAPEDAEAFYVGVRNARIRSADPAVTRPRDHPLSRVFGLGFRSSTGGGPSLP